MLIGLGIVVAGGGVFGAASFGFLQVPGISPTKFGKPVPASKDEHRGWIDTLSAPLQSLSRKAAIVAAAPKKPATADAPNKPKTDPSLGDEKIAEIWNGLDAKKLADITAKWSETNLAKVLLKMDPDQVTDYLAELPSDRAAKVSQAIQSLASIPPLVADANPS